jgi:O-6-methylguanine DNA methyltransferase
MTINYTALESPMGDVFLAENSRGLFYVGLGSGGLAGLTAFSRKHFPGEQIVPAIVDSMFQVQEYVSGQRRSFDLTLDLQGTDFQKEVWQALQQIPYGETSTYGEIARRLGRPGAARAVGRGCGTNPAPLVVPCHRVLASSGRLGGFSGGLDWKKWLLALENPA